VDLLIRVLEWARAHQHVAELVERLPAAGAFGRFLGVCGQGEKFRFGREPDGSPADAWSWDDLD
jgi:hypothetical protein